MSDASASAGDHDGNDEDVELESVVLFDLGSETYALRVDQVSRVVRPTEPVRLPGAPEAVLGVINLRGVIVAVVDPKVPLGLPSSELGAKRRVLVTDVGASPTGFLVDGVRDVVELGPDAFLPSPMPAGGDSRGVAGVVQIGERTVVLLDASELVPS